MGLLAAVALLLYGLLHGQTIQVLDPKGSVGHEERRLMFFALALSIIVVVPVFAMLGWFAWRYRDTHPKKAKYEPDWDRNPFLESVWWLVPSILIVILSIVTWRSSHALDPYKSLAGKEPLTVQVVALDWKWLFIYPEQNIASVNYARIPVDRPVNFQISADAPMNSFWVPQLGGQIYAMPGMATQLHLEAAETGKFRGSSANISGDGFAGMTFTVEATSEKGFEQWARQAKGSQALTFRAYDKLAQPSQNNPPVTYGRVEPKLFEVIIMKYMAPIQGISDTGSDRPGNITPAVQLEAAR